MRMPFLYRVRPQDVEAGLRTRAADADRLTAARGKKLLELVQYLLGRGPSPEVDALLESGRPVLMLAREVKSKLVFVRIWVDSYEGGPAENGLPVMHYRFQAALSILRRMHLLLQIPPICVLRRELQDSAYRTQS
jgi:hypothetical protein